MEIDLHIHSKYSFDSLLEPKTIVKFSRKQGLSAIAITDHDTIKGSFAVMQEASFVKNFIVLPGVEVKTDKGDVIGLFIQEEIKKRTFHEVIEEIKSQDGLTILPHPYNRSKGIVKDLLNYVDAVEVVNGRCSLDKNIKIRKIVKDTNKPAIASSDAHFFFEIGRVKTRFFSSSCNSEDIRKLILNSKREFIGKESPFIVHGLSFAINIIKQVTSPF
jgi:predicted metal-dependent phosphoesterase TrpH